ncbi:MAG TPA: hypothetical protein VGD10_10870 [Allosphingosinicella sp.]|uniref:hypothetical protein n=1 Tax=Allosphingosinicella sp. TaxID=2823234 RepID=UPI002ED966DA
MTKSEAGEVKERWWESPRYALLLVLLSAVPLLWPDIAPLVDLPGHMGRYRVQLDLAESEALQRFYTFEWRLIGNLGIDLLVIPLAPLLGLELAVRLIVLSIPPLTAAGLLLIARVVHGRLPPTAPLALPFAYSFPFHFGFVNFCLSIAFAFLAFALWRWLAIRRRFLLRAALFVPLSLLIWVTHTFGWGVLGVLAYAAEMVRHRDEGKGWFKSWFQAAFDVLPLVPPILLMVAWRSGQVGGRTTDWFNWEQKFRWFYMMLRDRWELFDVASVALMSFVIVIALLIMLWGLFLRPPERRRVDFSRMLAIFAIFLTLVFLLLPRVVFGSAYADMRLAPFAFAMALLAIRFHPAMSTGALRWIAIAALAFFLARTGATAASFLMFDRVYDRELQALNHVPRGARLVSFTGITCRQPWKMSRLEHMPALAVVRRDAFSNDQWTMVGAQLLGVNYPPGLRFVRDPSQMVTPVKCRGEFWLSLNQTLFHLPRNAFDYVWLIQPPSHDPRLTAGLTPLWRSGTSVLYRVDDRGSPAARGRE